MFDCLGVMFVSPFSKKVRLSKWPKRLGRRMIKFRDCTSDSEFLRTGNKSGSGNGGCEKVHQTDSNPGPHDQ